ncbi:MAG: metal ABC transporter permease [Thermofilaceae archaeon]|nr:metal ABC transporter permease [Thermofilaceae archaeon]MCX8180982.1 metal ABC transporter permease [Thermofilaceae archaeon]MDW8004087.1 metal ABC transporter permease [Thermofilaceae archaeon]
MYLDPRWVTVMVGSAAAFGALSPLIHARRFSFFAASLPHSALLSVALGYVASSTLGGHPAAWAILVSLPFSSILVHLIHRGVSEDNATSVFVAFTVSGSVAVIHYVLTNYPARVSLWSYILGDPLLASWEDAILTAAIASVTIFLSSKLLLKEMSIGLDSEFAAVSGIKVKFHNYLLALMLTAVAVSLLRVVGFVVEHVALLLPSAVAAQLARSAREFYIVSILTSVLASVGGLVLSVYLNVAPSAMLGFLLLLFYVVSLLTGG